MLMYPGSTLEWNEKRNANTSDRGVLTTVENFQPPPPPFQPLSNAETPPVNCPENSLNSGRLGTTLTRPPIAEAPYNVPCGPFSTSMRCTSINSGSKAYVGRSPQTNPVVFVPMLVAKSNSREFATPRITMSGPERSPRPEPLYTRPGTNFA